jgi:hypothetical protein
MALPEDLSARLAASLPEEASRRATRMDQLLGRIEQYAEWESAADMPEDLRALVRDARAGEARAVVDLLVSWRRMGGALSFVEPAAQSPTVQAVELPRDEDTERISQGKAPPPPRLAPAPAPVIPIGPAASLEALAGLKAHVESGGGFKVQPPPTDWPQRLADQLKELGPTRDVDGELNAVLRVVDALERWRHLPPEVQATLIGLIAARLRALQETPGFLADRRVDFAFGSLSAYVKRARPGFVYGLARWHTPNRETWEADAEALFERLSSMVPTPVEAEPNAQKQLELIESLIKEVGIAPAEARSVVVGQLRREVLNGFSMGIQGRNPRLVRALLPLAEEFEGTEFRTLRRAIRDELAEASAEADADGGAEEAPLPPDWAWWEFTRGKRALIIGGDPREQSRARLEKAFEMDELEWVGAEFKRNNLLGVRDRVRSGKTDLVLLLTRFTGHDADQIIIPACREMGISFVCVPHGYGVVRVRHAIERFLDPMSKR